VYSPQLGIFACTGFLTTNTGTPAILTSNKKGLFWSVAYSLGSPSFETITSLTVGPKGALYFAAAAYQGTAGVYMSADGKHWSMISSQTVYGLYYVSGMFFGVNYVTAFSNQNSIITSENGVTWNTLFYNFDCLNIPVLVASNGTVVSYVGSGGCASTATLTDPHSWSVSNTGVTTPLGINVLNNEFVVVGTTESNPELAVCTWASAPDAINWNAEVAPFQYSQATPTGMATDGESTLVVVGDGGVIIVAQF